MKYKTTIQIVSEAEDKNEALEIVGEYLLGNIVSGIDMKCRTKPVNHAKKIVVGVAAILAIFTVGLVSMVQMKAPEIGPREVIGMDAVQPPLTTSRIQAKDAEFKREWSFKHTKAALEHIVKK